MIFGTVMLTFGDEDLSLEASGLLMLMRSLCSQLKVEEKEDKSSGGPAFVKISASFASILRISASFVEAGFHFV